MSAGWRFGRLTAASLVVWILVAGCAGQSGYQRRDAWEPIGTQWKLRVQMTPAKDKAGVPGYTLFNLNAEILLDRVSESDSVTVDSVAIMYAPRSSPEIFRWRGSPETYSRNRILERVLLREPLPPTVACQVFFTLYEQGKRATSDTRDYPISR